MMSTKWGSHHNFKLYLLSNPIVASIGIEKQIPLPVVLIPQSLDISSITLVLSFSSTILSTTSLSCSILKPNILVNRGGQIPAPLNSLKN